MDLRRRAPALDGAHQDTVGRPACVAMNRQDPSVKLALRTGKDGRVRFRLPRGGMWLIKAVHMIPAPPASNADWESLWASLTFELPAAPAPSN